MPQSDKDDAKDRKQRLAAAMWQGERAQHHAKAQRANPSRLGIAVRHHTAAKANRTKKDREQQADFMEKRVDQRTPDRGQHREKHRRRDTMGHAQTRQGNSPSVKAIPS